MLKSVWNGIAGLVWLALIAVVGPTLVRPEAVESPHDRAIQVIEVAPPRPTIRRASIARPLAVGVVERPKKVIPAARKIEVERTKDVSLAEQEFIPAASWDVFRSWAKPDDRPDDGFRFFKLPDPPEGRRPVAHGEPRVVGRDLAQARYDNDQARYNIRETLARLEGMGIKVVLDWNGTFGTESPLDLPGCVAENWELRWRQQQLNALADGRTMPAYRPRPDSLNRVIPVGWTQCGSGVCKPDNPYCPYRPGGR